MVNDDQRHFSIQTQSWKLIVGSSKRLFVRPDDIWEYNDVAELCTEIVEELEVQLHMAIDHLSAGKTTERGFVIRTGVRHRVVGCSR